LWQHDAEFGQQPSDAVDASVALFFEAFAQAVYSKRSANDTLAPSMTAC